MGVNQVYSFDFLRILQIEGNRIVDCQRRRKRLEVKNGKNGFHEWFKELLAPNLDLLYLNSTGKLHIRKLGEEQFTFDLINLSFRYDLNIGPNGRAIFGKKGAEEATCSISKAEIREQLYRDGFELNGKEYVRYKRSSGAAREGNCLFINKKLFRLMDKWSGADLDPEDCEKDIVSFEAYKALSLSSLIGTLSLKPENILVVKDFVATLPAPEKVARVHARAGTVEAEENECAIRNKIWDGEGLLDESVFSAAEVVVDSRKKTLGKNGMMLLRNRFFKSCVFNTKLQKWFAQNGIQDVGQLNGITFAKKIEDVKMVITESSLKYLKMGGGYNRETILKWCQAVSDPQGNSLFGIVKTDKPQRFFYGEMVETTYQLLNTLHLTERKVRNLLQWNFDSIAKIRNIQKTPEYLRLFLEGEADVNDVAYDEVSEVVGDSEDENIETAEETAYTFKKVICSLLMGINRDVLKTKPFRRFVYEETINSLATRLYDGRVLVHGTYATLFGNPYELLLHLVHRFEDGKSAFLHKGKICSSFFDKSGADIVGSRSPHITMGNILYAKNVRNPDIEKWFNLTKEIVIVDAIENNIQVRLNGADYDSDSMLITDDEVIVSAVKEQYDRFLVPYPDFEGKTDVLADALRPALWQIDDTIANNKVGSIVNDSQLLNSYYWDTYNNRKNDPSLKDIYLNIAKLAVLSGAEIDSAKRKAPFVVADELDKIEGYMASCGLVKGEGDKGLRLPMFFQRVRYKKAFGIGRIDSLIANCATSKFKTTMDYLWESVQNESLEGGRFRGVVTFSSLTKGGIPRSKRGGKQYEIIDAMIEGLEIIYDARIAANPEKRRNGHELEKRLFKENVQEYLRKYKAHLGDLDMIRLTIQRLERRQKKDGAKECCLPLLLCYVIYCAHGSDARDFFRKLFNGNAPVYPLKRIAYSPKSPFLLYNKYSYEVATSPIDRLVDTIFYS